MKRIQTIKKEIIKEEFDDKFTVNGEGKEFFDIEEWRTKEYIKARKPSATEIRKAFLKALDRVAKESVEAVRLEERKYGKQKDHKMVESYLESISATNGYNQAVEDQQEKKAEFLEETKGGV